MLPAMAEESRYRATSPPQTPAPKSKEFIAEEMDGLANAAIADERKGLKAQCEVLK